jgi:hypothetical protein
MELPLLSRRITMENFVLQFRVYTINGVNIPKIINIYDLITSPKDMHQIRIARVHCQVLKYAIYKTSPHMTEYIFGEAVRSRRDLVRISLAVEKCPLNLSIRAVLDIIFIVISWFVLVFFACSIAAWYQCKQSAYRNA